MSAALPDRSAVIAAGQTASAAVGTGQAGRGSFFVPDIVGTAITVNVSDNGTNWTTCPVEGNEANPITVADNNTYSFPVKAFSFRFFQLVSGSTETDGDRKSVV